MKLVVVESPAKAKTINKYLGKDYEVIASYGHIRDLPSKQGSVDPEKDFAMQWEVDTKGQKHVNQIAKAVKNKHVDTLILATDPDREGEAISWHVKQVLREENIRPDIKIERITFNEITKKAVLAAINNPRDLDDNLISAYLARRALDYLVGFNVSPVLWRKLPGSKSAGRVQSVALRLVCEREEEIEAFIIEEYWSISGLFGKTKNETFSAKLQTWQNQKLEKLSLKNSQMCEEIIQFCKQKRFLLHNREEKVLKRNPAPPFMTSTLQQEASRKLGFSATKTMRIAQQLYEEGLITYMRTDSIYLGNEAIGAVRDYILAQFGKPYLPHAPRQFKSKIKNAQEAHEAIRPTSFDKSLIQVKKDLEDEPFKLYELIFKRTIASQMEQAVFDQVIYDIVDEETKGYVSFRSVGTVLKFDGFLTLYREDKDDKDENDENDEMRRLPALTIGDPLTLYDITSKQHFTEPPPRFSEASLVKKLEELGIGRPSTYASILQVLQDRKYVKLEKKRFIPEELGRFVTVFLRNFFGRYVEYNFTADLEDQLDDISNGVRAWKKVLHEFWQTFSHTVKQAFEIEQPRVLAVLEKELSQLLFQGDITKTCPSCQKGMLSLKLGKFGAFLGCSEYPECRYTHNLSLQDKEEGGTPAKESIEPRKLGEDPKLNCDILLKKGPYGWYLEWAEEHVKKPKRVSIPKEVDLDTIDLDFALKFSTLPREIGVHPETKEPIMGHLGKYGPYLKMGNASKPLSNLDELFSIGMNRAVDLFAQSKGASEGKEIGKHPENNEAIILMKGRYGPYLKWNKQNIKITKGYDPDHLTLAQALELIEKAATKKK